MGLDPIDRQSPDISGACSRLAPLDWCVYYGASVLKRSYSQDKFANSVRWSRTGGLLEMTRLLWGSKNSVPGTSRAILATTMIAGILSLVVSSVLTVMVSRADIQDRPVTTKTLTAQLVRSDPLFWTAFHRPDATMEGTLTSMLNDTRYNPNSDPRTRYTPRTTAFEVACDETTAMITRNFSSNIYMPNPKVTCRGFYMLLTLYYYEWDPMTANIRTINSNTMMAVAPLTPMPNPSNVIQSIQPLFSAMTPDYKLCYPSLGSQSGLDSATFPKDGVINLPTTIATKCEYGTEGSVATSVTYVKFAVGRLKDFNNVTSSVFDNPEALPLLKHLDNALVEGTFDNPTGNASIIFLAQIPSSVSDVDYLMCMPTYQKEKREMGLICTYMLTSIIIAKPQELDPTIAADLKGHLDIRNKQNATNLVDFTIHHLPQVPESENSLKTTPFYSVAHLSNASSDAAKYVMSLGRNVRVFKDEESIGEQLYILYDAVNLRDGYEVSTTAFVVVCVLTVLFATTWILSERLFPASSNSTLYKTIYADLKSKDDSKVMLMECEHDPLSFDGHRVVPTSEERDILVHNALPQDLPSTTLQNYIGVQAPLQELQPLMTGAPPPIPPKPQLAGSLESQTHGPNRQEPVVIQSPFE
ncbi:hypothetical protein BG004_005461 [Podila humilis]|nr:hypothetical protein BG004_005461 [Podila humilis]